MLINAKKCTLHHKMCDLSKPGRVSIPSSEEARPAVGAALSTLPAQGAEAVGMDAIETGWATHGK